VFFGEIEGLRHRAAFVTHLAPLMRKNWFVYVKPPFTGPEAVLGPPHGVATRRSAASAAHASIDTG
jgi:hypothetical protein